MTSQRRAAVVVFVAVITVVAGVTPVEALAAVGGTPGSDTAPAHASIVASGEPSSEVNRRDGPATAVSVLRPGASTAAVTAHARQVRRARAAWGDGESGVGSGHGPGLTRTTAQSVNGTYAVDRCRSTPLNESGVYELTANVTGPADEPCLFINADDVVLDGNGHVIEGNGSGGNHGHPIVVQNSTTYPDTPRGPVSNVTVRDVVVDHWTQQVAFYRAENGTVRDAVITNGYNTAGTGSGFGLLFRRGGNHTVVDTTVADFPGQGIQLRTTRRVRIARTTVRNTSRLSVTDGANHTVVNSTFVDNGVGVDVDGTVGLRVANNVVRSNFVGLKLEKTEHSSVRDNVVEASGKHGINVAGGRGVNNTVSDNVVRGSDQLGVRVRDAGATRVRNNTVVDAGNHGIFLWAAGDSVVRNNTVRRNRGNGIHLNSISNVTVVGNVVTNHTVPGQRSGAGLKLKRSTTAIGVRENVFRDNRDGIEALFGSPDSGTIERNRIVDNAETGIRFGSGTSVELFDVRRNVIADNGEYGLRNENDAADVDARDNWWGAPTGPSSPAGVTGNLTDPVTGTTADGDGDAVSANGSAVNASNVRFDPWLTTPPDVAGSAFRITTARLPRSKLGAPVADRLETRDATGGVRSITVVNGTLPPGLTLHDDGVLNGTPTAAGSFEFTVRATDGANATATRTLTKRVSATVPRPSIDVEKAGTGATPGRTSLYLIRVENTGSTVARDVPVNEYVQPWFSYVDATPLPDEISASVVRGGTEAEFESLLASTGQDVDLDGNVTKTTLSWRIDELRPGESRLLTYQVRLDDRAPAGFTVSGEACTCDGGCCENFHRCKKEVIAGCAVPGSLGRGSTTVDCITLDADGCLYGLFGPDPEELCRELGNKAICKRDYKACRAFNGLAPDEPPCDEEETNVTVASDPNEKLVATDRYVQSNETLPYTVNFENVGNATATNVTVTDDLPRALNRSAIAVFDANRTRRSLAPGETVTLLRRNQTRNRTVTIGNRTVTRTETVVEKHTATLSNGTLEWRLQNIDLEPNGTGSLLASARVRRTAANGTRIENDATIRFDEVDQLTTNATVNVVDDVPPACRVETLPARSPRRVSLSWTGSDDVGRIDSVTLLASADGGPWEVIRTGLAANTTTFEGTLGTDYRFSCVAVDTAGNRETDAGAPTVEATTTVAAVDVNGTVREADGDPAANDTVAVGAPTSGRLTGVFDVEGVAVCRAASLDRAATDGAGRFSVTTGLNATRDVSYFQAPPGTFLRENDSLPAGTTPFPRDGSPDLYALGRTTPTTDTSLGDRTLPAGHVLDVRVVSDEGDPVENASVAIEHVGPDGARATVIVRNATGPDGTFEHPVTDATGLEVTGNVSVTVRPPGADGGRFVRPVTTRNLSVTEDRSVTVRLETPPAFDRPLPTGEATPGDPDFDGTYEDLDGDGTVAYDDVVTLFVALESAVVESAPDAVDFNGNGRVDFADLVALYEEVSSRAGG